MNTVKLLDRYHRRIDYLRIAVTDQCNLRCMYCMPKDGIRFQDESEQLTASEISRAIETAAQLGIRKIRFTGGEPLLRNDISTLVGIANDTPGIRSVHLTTNGLNLNHHLDDLKSAGIQGINISLDSLNAARYLHITRRESFERVWKNLCRTLEIGIPEVKLNVVALRDLSVDEVAAFMELSKSYPLTVRFIELMPFNTNPGKWQHQTFTSANHVLGVLKQLFPELRQTQGSSTETHYFSLEGYQGHVAVIPAYTRTMCRACSRLRLTSNGKLLNCLYSSNPIDLLTTLRSDAPKKSLEELFKQAVITKPKNGHSARNHRSDQRISMTQIGG